MGFQREREKGCLGSYFYKYEEFALDSKLQIIKERERESYNSKGLTAKCGFNWPSRNILVCFELCGGHANAGFGTFFSAQLMFYFPAKLGFPDSTFSNCDFIWG